MGKRLQDPAIVARGLVEKANYFRRMDLPDSAKSLLNEAEKMSIDINDHNLHGILSQRIGILYRDERKMDSSIIYFNRALKHYKPAGDQFQYAQTLDQVSGTHMDNGDMETAKAYLEESFSILDVLMKEDSSYAIVRKGIRLSFEDAGMEAYHGAKDKFEDELAENWYKLLLTKFIKPSA